MTNSAFPASFTHTPTLSTVVAFNSDSDEPVYVADSNHPHWNEIVSGLHSGDPEVWELFDVAGGVMQQFKQVTDRVSWDGEQVLWDGDPIHSVLAEQLERAIKDGNSSNYLALAKFWEKLESNPNEHSRQQAYDFLATHAFQITLDGDVVGYKGVTSMDDGTYRSSATSQAEGKPSAFVNGKPQPPLSRVTQNIGDIVSMPRSEVTHDPAKACERGLHVATRSYAKSYGTVMEVTFNPRDIVSVPTADSGAKVRVCRYKVNRLAPENGSTGPVLRESEPEKTWAGDVGYKV